jgi:hypothetical protein
VIRIWYVLATSCFIYMLVDLTTSDLHPAITLAATAHSFHIWEQRIFTAHPIKHLVKDVKDINGHQKQVSRWYAQSLELGRRVASSEFMGGLQCATCLFVHVAVAQWALIYQNS